MKPRRILIDTDPGIDDAMAIFYALASPELDVVGLTTVFGNHHTDVCTRNALVLLDLADRPDIPVAAGATAPLAMAYRGPVGHIHGDNGQGNAALPAPSRQPIEADAASFIIDTVMAAPGEITVVTLGPLTNLALAAQREPRLAASLAGVVSMAGNAFCDGNASPCAEANVINDPEAADIVFGLDCPVAMLGLDVTARTVMSSRQLDAIGSVDTPMARHLSAITPLYRTFYADHHGIDGIFVHDSSTISWLLAPKQFRSIALPVRVDCGHGVGRGKTWASAATGERGAPWAGRRPVTIVTGVDAHAVVTLELQRLGVAPR